jgi:superfamily II DNA/RNA helicase
MKIIFFYRYQTQAIPIYAKFSRRNIMGQAKTGTGKTISICDPNCPTIRLSSEIRPSCYFWFQLGNYANKFQEFLQ